MPVAEQPYVWTTEAFEKIREKRYKKNRPPSPFVEAQKVPTKKQEASIAKLLYYNSLWLSLTYGADLVGMYLPWLGKGIRQLIKLRFKGKWEQKELGIDLGK